MINVLFFASLREKMKTDSLQLETIENETIGELKQRIMNSKEDWQGTLANNVLAAVNQEMVGDSATLTDHSEVAFFPPVTGG